VEPAVETAAGPDQEIFASQQTLHNGIAEIRVILAVRDIVRYYDE
jgi:hypothetical protein